MTKFIATILLFSAVSLPLASFGQAVQRTVRIAAVNSENGMVTSVDLAVSAGADEISLYAVRGAVDQGPDMNAWDTIDSVATVPASESELTYNYPMSQPFDAAYRFVLASYTLPFKKQLAFLKSTGSEYFILGDKCPNQDWRVTADVSFNYFVSGYSQGYWGPEKRQETRPSSVCAKPTTNFALTQQAERQPTPAQKTGAIRSIRQTKACPLLGMADLTR